jgi:hypothetical protein
MTGDTCVPAPGVYGSAITSGVLTATSLLQRSPKAGPSKQNL